MTETPINKNSPEYKQGYKEGILHTTILGVTCTGILTGIGLYAIHQLANSNKNSVNIEQKVDSDKYVKFTTNPDESTEQALRGCQTESNRQMFDECYNKLFEEGCINK